jgi:hypothetical protein
VNEALGGFYDLSSFLKFIYQPCNSKNSVFTNLSDKNPQDAKQQINERIKSMLFLCLYCNSKNPIAATIIGQSGPIATAFFICSDCKNKFVVKIEDVGKVRHV